MTISWYEIVPLKYNSLKTQSIPMDSKHCMIKGLHCTRLFVRVGPFNTMLALWIGNLTGLFHLKDVEEVTEAY